MKKTLRIIGEKPWAVIHRVAVNHFGPDVWVGEPRFNSYLHNVLDSCIGVPYPVSSDPGNYCYACLCCQIRGVGFTLSREVELAIWEKHANEACGLIKERFAQNTAHGYSCWQEEKWASRRTDEITAGAIA